MLLHSIIQEALSARHYYFYRLMNKETETQNGESTCLKPHCQKVGELQFESSRSRVRGLTIAQCRPIHYLPIVGAQQNGCLHVFGKRALGPASCSAIPDPRHNCPLRGTRGLVFTFPCPASTHLPKQTPDVPIGGGGGGGDDF